MLLLYKVSFNNIHSQSRPNDWVHVPGTCAARVTDDQIKRVLEQVVNDSGLSTDNRTAKYMSDLVANLKSKLISEIEKVT